MHEIFDEGSDGIIYHFVNYFKRIAISHGSWATFERMEDGLNMLMSVICICIAGLGAGLTMGLLSLDQSKLEIKAMVGSPAEKLAAIRLLPIVKQHHSLLVTLLLTNSIASESLPIFLGEIVPNIYAVLLSVFCIFIFGEIIPTAFFTGPGQLLMAGRCHNIVKWMMWLLYPITYPISSFLDHLFSHGQHNSSISRAELGAIIAMQAADHVSVLDTMDNGNSSDPLGNSAVATDRTPVGPAYGSMDAAKTPGKTPARAPILSPVTENLKQSEVGIMSSILQLAGTSLREALIPVDGVYCLCGSTRLDRRFLLAIARTGYSRVPVYFEHRRRFVGYILTKSLLEVDPTQCLPVSALPLRQPLIVSPEVSLLSILDMFRTGKCNIAFVCNAPDVAVRYIQHKLQVESYLDQVAQSTTDVLRSSTAARQRDGCILSPANMDINRDIRDRTEDQEGRGDPSVADNDMDIELARELNLLPASGGGVAVSGVVASALGDMEIIGIITLQDVLQKIFRGHDLYDTVLSGSKYTRFHTPMRGTVNNLSYSAASVGPSATSSAFNSAHNSTRKDIGISGVPVDHNGVLDGVGGDDGCRHIHFNDTDHLLPK